VRLSFENRLLVEIPLKPYQTLFKKPNPPFGIPSVFKEFTKLIGFSANHINLSSIGRYGF
jgi:hypothetical protein